ncbi:type II toxin-antitoxin system VapC family toxin [Sphingomonas panacis]|uniref:type II toxin-antitoxin system VapC family toxin n=1 Tax=Sphingomonas panacis TaxID=1560345 RepID=UPI0009F59B3F|nr:type II toxin-antitoxin system VapC family toxin [Sphingomonas panacis]
MRVLLDTHILLWMARSPQKLSRFERGILASEDVSLLVSVISIWEIRIKWQKFDRNGVRKGELSPEDALTYVERNDLALIPLSGADFTTRLEPPLVHNDPFDEMLLVHAARRDAKLLTRDRQLIGHPLAITPV